MKLLFDENISYRIVKKMDTLFPRSKHLSDLNLAGYSDKQIWNFAKVSDYAIVTFDADFYDFVTLFGHPPKVIWLRMGNTTTENIAIMFEKHFREIILFLEEENNDNIGCFEINS